jgi:hypothetical protein
MANLYSDALYVSGQAIVPSMFEGELHEAMSLIPDDIIYALSDSSMIPYVADHLTQMEELYDPIVDRWVDALDSAIEILVSTVAPAYVEYLDQANLTLMEMDVITEANSYYVEMVGFPDWFLNSSAWFNDQNKGTTPNFQALPELRFNPMASPPHVEILKQMCASAGGTTWLNQVIHSRLPALNAVFDGVGSSQYLNAKFNEQNPFDRVNDAVMILLLTRIMADSPPESLAINVQAYNMYLRNVKLLAQSAITKAMPLINIYNQQQKMVISCEPGLKRIRVVGTIFERDYAAKGGAIDALLGLLISSDGARNAPDILNNQKKYMELWIMYRAQSQLNRSATYLAQTKRVLRRLIDTMRVTELEVMHHGVEEGSILPEHVRKQMFDYINELTITDIDKLDLAAAKIIGLGRFDFTPAYGFLVDMIAAKVDNTHVTANAAMYAAVKNHIAKYLVQNIEVKKV